MSVIYLVLPLAVILAGVFLVAFIWCVRRGQYDDVDTPALRMLDSSHDGGRAAKPASKR